MLLVVTPSTRNAAERKARPPPASQAAIYPAMSQTSLPRIEPTGSSNALCLRLQARLPKRKTSTRHRLARLRLYWP